MSVPGLAEATAVDMVGLVVNASRDWLKFGKKLWHGACWPGSIRLAPACFSQG